MLVVCSPWKQSRERALDPKCRPQPQVQHITSPTLLTHHIRHILELSHTHARTVLLPFPRSTLSSATELPVQHSSCTHSPLHTHAIPPLDLSALSGSQTLLACLPFACLLAAWLASKSAHCAAVSTTSSLFTVSDAALHSRLHDHHILGSEKHERHRALALLLLESPLMSRTSYDLC